MLSMSTPPSQGSRVLDAFTKGESGTGNRSASADCEHLSTRSNHVMGNDLNNNMLQQQKEQHNEEEDKQPQSSLATGATNNIPAEAAAAAATLEQETPEGALDLSKVENLKAVGADQVGQHDVKPEDVLRVEDVKNGAAADPNANVDFYGRPRPKNLVRKWPSLMMYLMSQSNDDEWQDVVDRVNSHPQEISIQGVNGGMNALHACCVRYPPVHVVRAIVDKDPSCVLQRNFNGETPLHIASYSSSEEVQVLLVQKVPEAATLQDQYGDSPLHFAARAGATFKLMEAFVSASPTMISKPNDRGVTPFWLLPRSFLETDDLEEVMDPDGEDYRDDWDNLALFLRYSYFPTGTKVAQIRDEEGTPLPLRREDFAWISHAAAATPSCPREVLKWLCRMFPEQALRGDDHGYTPLLLAVQRKEMKEPKKWNSLEDGYREHVDVVDGELRNENEQLEEEETALDAGNAVFLEELFQRTLTETDDETSRGGSVGSEFRVVKESVVEILLEWSPRSALHADAEGRLPLTHALLNGLSWKSSISKLISACPRALERRDAQSGLYNFQLAAINSPQLDTVYSLVRSLPELLAREHQDYELPPPSSAPESQQSSALKRSPENADESALEACPSKKQKM